MKSASVFCPAAPQLGLSPGEYGSQEYLTVHVYVCVTLCVTLCGCVCVTLYVTLCVCATQGKGQYFDSGDYNMQGGKPASGGGAAGAGGPKEAAGPVQSKLASSAAPAVTPGPGPARIPQRRKSQPSKLGADQPSPTSPKPTSPMAGP